MIWELLDFSSGGGYLRFLKFFGKVENNFRVFFETKKGSCLMKIFDI